jgi:hypothetical protein
MSTSNFIIKILHLHNIYIHTHISSGRPYINPKTQRMKYFFLISCCTLIDNLQKIETYWRRNAVIIKLHIDDVRFVGSNETGLSKLTLT